MIAIMLHLEKFFSKNNLAGNIPASPGTAWEREGDANSLHRRQDMELVPWAVLWWHRLSSLCWSRRGRLLYISFEIDLSIAL